LASDAYARTKISLGAQQAYAQRSARRPQAAIQRRQRQVFALRQFKIGGVV